MRSATALRARPRFFEPARSVFMMIVVDQVSPWLTPSSALAASEGVDDDEQGELRQVLAYAEAGHRSNIRP